MTVQECYAKLNGSYEDAKKVLMSDRLIEKFMLKYPQEPTMQQLRDALAAKDVMAARTALHQLKGVTANLGFTGLMNAVEALNAPMREGREYTGDLVQAVEDAYALVINTLKEYENERV